MADQPQQKAKPAGVSPARKIVSGVVLVAALAVAALELRASLGQRQSMAALKANEEDPAKIITHEEAKALLSLSPAEELVNENDVSAEYKYSWFSLLRRDQMRVFMIVDKGNPPKFVTSATEPDSDLISATAQPDGQEMAPEFQPGGGSPPSGATGAAPSRPEPDDSDDNTAADEAGAE